MSKARACIRSGGVIALPLRSLLYVREKDVPALSVKYGWKFRPKPELAVYLTTWFVTSVRWLSIESSIGQMLGRAVELLLRGDRQL